MDTPEDRNELTQLFKVLCAVEQREGARQLAQVLNQSLATLAAKLDTIKINGEYERGIVRGNIMAIDAMREVMETTVKIMDKYDSEHGIDR